jgi:PAS domain S-box-containing protein
MRAVDINAPVGSKRMKLVQSTGDSFGTVVSLPVYKMNQPTRTIEQRRSALKGFVAFVIKIEPMIEIILDERTHTAGLHLEFYDTDAPGNEQFLYTHYSRADSIEEEQEPVYQLEQSIIFADRKWKVIGKSASLDIYPEWTVSSLILPFLIMLGSFGIAAYLLRSSKRDEEREIIINELESTETALKEIQERFELAIDGSGDALWEFDSRTRENWFSPRLLELLGYDPGELSGSWENLLGSWKNLLHPDDSEKARAAFADHLAQDVPYDIEYRMRTKSGDYHWFQVRGKSLRDATGRAYRTSGSISDTTQRKAIETELAAAKEIAEEATQAKSDFLANMSHELRTPMNAILGYSEMLMEEAEDLEQEDFIPDLKKINQAGKHLLSLINDVLDLSKIESGKMEAFAESIDLDSLIDEVSATTQPLMGKNGNKLSIERGKNLGSAHQDLTKLRQTLFNLLSNAAKFTQEGTITLHVNRIEQAGENWLSFAVSDTGIGIAADKLEHVFMEFAQADDSTTRNYGGTGLGLAISRRFCQLLGGDLSVHSVLGEGSTFTIRIPANLPEAEPQQPSADKPAAKTDAELETLHNVRPGSAILVIDDDPAACEIIERYLIKDGYSVATANSGEQGLRLAHDIQPAAITLDVMMPDMDGWSVLRALKADPVLRTIPVIMLSMIDDRMRGYSLGAVDYLTKPVDRGLLHKTLSRYYSSDASSTVLLVEDNEETRELMTRTLESSGWVVSGAGNGQEALDIMADLQPRLILLDLMMPVMDGFDFLAALRAKPKWQHIPVIVVTAKDLTADERNRLAVNTEKVLEKNAFTREQLLERIHEAAAACSIDQPT